MGTENFNQQNYPGQNQQPNNQGYNQPNTQGYNQPYNQGYNQGYGQPQTPPDNGMVWAILTTLFCCLPFGIVAIIKASSVNGLWMSGNYDAALNAAKSSKNWSLAAACSGLVVLVIYFMLFIFGIAAGL